MFKAGCFVGANMATCKHYYMVAYHYLVSEHVGIVAFTLEASIKTCQHGNNYTSLH